MQYFFPVILFSVRAYIIAFCKWVVHIFVTVLLLNIYSKKIHKPNRVLNIILGHYISVCHTEMWKKNNSIIISYMMNNCHAWFILWPPWQNCSEAVTTARFGVWLKLTRGQRRGFFSPSHWLWILSWSVCGEILSKSQCVLTLCQQHVFMDFHCWQSPHFCWPRTSRITLCKYARVHTHTHAPVPMSWYQTPHINTTDRSLITNDERPIDPLTSVFIWSNHHQAMLLSK